MASKRSHPVLSFRLLRSGLLSSQEIALLAIVGSFSHGCHVTAPELATMLRLSDRQVRRVIDRLFKTGLLGRKYGRFKSLHLYVVSEEFQDYWFLKIRDTAKPWSEEDYRTWVSEDREGLSDMGVQSSAIQSGLSDMGVRTN